MGVDAQSLNKLKELKELSRIKPNQPETIKWRVLKFYLPVLSKEWRTEEAVTLRFLYKVELPGAHESREKPIACCRPGGEGSFSYFATCQTSRRPAQVNLGVHVLQAAEEERGGGLTAQNHNVWGCRRHFGSTSRSDDSSTLSIARRQIRVTALVRAPVIRIHLQTFTSRHAGILFTNRGRSTFLAAVVTDGVEFVVDDRGFLPRDDRT